MTIRATCPDCGASFANVPDDYVGRTARCKKCGSKFRIATTDQLPGPAPAGSRGSAQSDSEGPAHWNAGDVIINLYEVQELLGEGGMGTVHKVRHRGWDMSLAVKSPKASILERAGGAENFEREAETWVNMGLHPHTVSCYYVRRLGGIPRVFAEYVSGGSLADWIHEGKLYHGGSDKALERMLDIAIQFAWGLQYSHEQGLIHQDVKPGNVMITSDGIAKVTDFGLARAKPMSGPDGGDGKQTMMAQKAGMTPAYASPEQSSGKTLTRRTDLWSWGVSFLEMFTGEVTWPVGSVALEALEGYLETGPEDEAIPRMPDSLADTLRTCFREDPEDRPHDMGEVAVAVANVYLEETGNAYPRKQPKAGRDMADSLNNRAISLLDLGKLKEAEHAWAAALKADPHHLEATFNMSMYEWKHRAITEGEIYRRIEEIGRTHTTARRYKQLEGIIYLSFGEYKKAVSCLKEASDTESPSVEVLRDLALAMCAEAGDSGDQARWMEVENCFVRVREAGYEDPYVVTGSAFSLMHLDQAYEAGRLYSGAVERRNDLPASLDEAVHRFLPGHEVVASTIQLNPVYALSVSPDGRRVSCGSPDRILTWEIQDNKFEPPTEVRINFGELQSMAFSRDHRFILSGDDGATLSLWDVAAGRLIRKTRSSTGRKLALVFSPDGLSALSAGSDRVLRLWDLKRGENTVSFQGHTSSVCAAVFHHSKQYALSGSRDKTLRLWDIKTGRCPRVFTGHQATVTCAAFSPNGSYALSASEDRTLRLWDIKSGKCVRMFGGHAAPVTCAAFSPDGRYVLAASDDMTLRVWDIRKGVLENLFRFQKRIEAMAVSPDSGHVVMALAGGTSAAVNNLALIEYSSLDRYRAPYIVSVPMTASEAGAIETDFQQKLDEAKRHAVGGNYQKAFRSLDEARSIPGFERGSEALTLWQELGARFPNKRLREVWEVQSLKGHESAVHAVSVPKEGGYALSGGLDNTLRLWDLKTGQLKRTMEGHDAQVTSVALDNKGSLGVSGSSDRTVRVWKLKTGECIRTITRHTDLITAVAISPDGRYALSAAGDSTFYLWSLKSGTLLTTLEGHESYVTALAVSPDGIYAVSGGMDRTLRLWELATGRCIQVLEGHREHITSVAISDDGLYAVSGGDDGTVRRWGLKTGELLRTISGHEKAITSVDISPDGMLAVSGSRDRSICLWDLKTGTCVHTLEGHTDEVSSVACGPDGHFLLSAGLDKTLRVWQLVWDPDICNFSNWDEGARPYLGIFLTLHTPFSGKGPARKGTPEWDRKDFKNLYKDLSHRGFGWLEPEGVEDKLNNMALQWQGPVAAAEKYATRKPKKAWYDNKIILFPLKYWKYAVGLLAIVLVYLAISSVINVSRLGLPDGFRDAKFCMNINEFSDMEQIDDGGNAPANRLIGLTYRKADEDLSFGGAELYDIHYKFESGRLTKIILYPGNLGQLNVFQRYYREKYGRGRQFVNGGTGKIAWVWRWKKEGVEISLVMDPESENEVYIVYMCNPRIFGSK